MVKVYCMYGLGGAWWSAGVERVIASKLRKIQGVEVPITREFGDWEDIADDINSLPKGTKVAVIGHSMGAATATYVTDRAKVDLVICLDLAGKVPSKIGKNTGKLIDVYDTAPDLVPEWRPQAVKGHEKKIVRHETFYGHTGVDDAPYVADLCAKYVKELL